MSEVKSSGDIEDILSSIRRLVSEDLRPLPRAKIVSRLVVEDKLILTQALRVVPKSAPLPRLHLEAAIFRTRPTPDVVATLTQGVDQQAPDWDPEIGDPAPDIDSLDWSSFTFARRPSHPTWRPQQPPLVATPKPTALASWAQPDPDEGAPELVLGSAPDGAPASVRDRILTPVPTFKPAPVPEAPMATDVADTRPAFPPEFASEWADEAEAEVLANLNTPDLNTCQAEILPGPAQEDDNIFSEPVLRELVRDLIREELQGDLGERIKRNIRKLVKVEIARALDIRALD